MAYSVGTITKPKLSEAIPKGPNWRTSDSSVGSLARCASGRARVRFLGIATRVPHQVLFSVPLIISVAFHAWCHKGTAPRSSPTELWRFPVISRRTRSSYLCVVVGLIVHVWCACVGGCVCACMNRCYSCTQMRGVKKNCCSFTCAWWAPN